MSVNGQMRKVLVRPERNGYLYVLDRTTGEVLSATPYAHITSMKGVDLQSGRLVWMRTPRGQRLARCSAAFSL